MPINNVRKQAIKVGKTVDLVMNQLVGDPVLRVEHLGESNFGYLNDSLAQAGAKAARFGGQQQRTPEMIKRERDENRATVAKHGVRGLGTGWFHDDANGNADTTKPVKSDEAGIREVVDSLPDEVFDSLFLFCLNAENFRDHAIAVPADELAKK